MEILQLISRESLQLIRDGFVSSREHGRKNDALCKDRRALESIDPSAFCAVLLDHFRGLYLLYKDYLPPTIASNPHEMKNVETYANLQKMLTRFFSLSQAERIGELFQVFDTIDIDSIGTISWDDISTFLLRVARITQVSSQVYRTPSYRLSRTMSPPIFCHSVYFCSGLKTLFVIDREFSVITSFTSIGAFDAQHDPIKLFERFLTIKKRTKKSYAEKKNVTNSIETQSGGIVRTSHTNITCMTFVERHQYVVFCTSNCGILACSSKTFKHMNHSTAKEVQVGIAYNNRLDLLLTWSDGINNDVLIWDASKIVILYSVTRHSSCILDLCLVETLGTSFVVSCDIDRQVFLWSLDSVDIALGRKKPGRFNDPLLCRSLKGHDNAIRRLCFAKENSLILGAGFDWDIYGWDPEDGRLSMKLSGHMSGNLSLFTVVVGTERAVTHDTGGLLKVWNITSIDVGNRAVCLYTLNLSSKETSLHIEEVYPAFDGGLTLACRLVDRIAFCELADADEQNQVVPGGLGVSRRLKRHWVVAPEQIKFTFGSVEKTITIKEFDTSEVDPLRHFVSSEVVTVATTDSWGKKIIIGTSGGAVKVYDSGAFGLQRVCIPANVDRLAVVGLHYVDSDRLVVAVFSSGDVKIANCAIKVPSESSSKINELSAVVAAEVVGRRFPPQPGEGEAFVLRECSYHLRPSDDTTGMAMSESLALIATYNKSGFVCLLDYCSLEVVCAYHLPPVDGQRNRAIHALRFLPSAPMMMVGDSIGKVTAYAVRPLPPAWLLTFSVEEVFVDDASKRGRMIIDLFSLGNAKENNFFASISAMETMHYKIATPREMPVIKSEATAGARSSAHAKHGMMRRASLKAALLKTSAVLHDNEWVVVVGNNIGYVCGVDITNLVLKAGVRVEKGQDAFSLTVKPSSSSPYVMFDKKVTLSKDAKSHIDNPVGLHVFMENCGPFGITSADLGAKYRFSTHRDKVSSLVLDRVAKNYYNRASSTLDLVSGQQSLPPAPRFLLTAYDLHDDVAVWGIRIEDSERRPSSQEWLQLEDAAPECAIEAYVPFWNKRRQQDAAAIGSKYTAMETGDVDCVDFVSLQRDYIMHRVDLKEGESSWRPIFRQTTSRILDSDEDSWVEALDTDFQRMSATQSWGEAEATPFGGRLMDTFRANNGIVLEGCLLEPRGNERKLANFNSELSLKRGGESSDALFPTLPQKVEGEVEEFRTLYMSPDKESLRVQQSAKKGMRRPLTAPAARGRGAEQGGASPVKSSLNPETTFLTEPKGSSVKASTVKTDLERIDDIFRSTTQSFSHTAGPDWVQSDAEALKSKVVDTIKRVDLLVKDEQQPLSSSRRVRTLSIRSESVKVRKPKPLNFVGTSSDGADAKLIKRKIVPAFKRGRYGFYNVKDMCILLKFMHQIREDVIDDEHFVTDDNAPSFSKEALLNHELVRDNVVIKRTITESLRAMKDDFDIFITKADIVHCMCPHSTAPEKSRICNFLSALEGLHWMLCHCHPPGTEKMHWNLLGSRKSPRNLCSFHLSPNASPSATAMASALAAAAAAAGPRVTNFEYCAIDADLPLPTALYEAANANGFRGWELAREKYRAVAALFCRMSACSSGTVTFFDVVTIIQSMFSPSYFNNTRSLSILHQRLHQLTDVQSEVDDKGLGLVLKALGITKKNE